MNGQSAACNSSDHWNRRTLLKAAGASGLLWLTPVACQLALAVEEKKARARSVILLWLQGGPSQLETFDPHPGKKIGGETKGIATSVKNVQLAAGMPKTAELMQHLALVRSVVSKEGDHERATYNVKTGFRPIPGFVHPAIGAVLCHQLPAQYAPGKAADIPRHVTILPSQWPGRGGYLGDQFDAFQVSDPLNAVPDVASRVAKDRFEQRLNDLNVVEQAFARGRLKDLESRRTLHHTTLKQATTMMTSDQLKAFDVSQTSAAERAAFGDTPFGRGCLTAARLVEVGVRCVEVTLGGWDTHANNHAVQTGLAQELDSALAALVLDLRARDLFDDTLVMVGGEFGRTPAINIAGGRDHWPHGFSLLLAGGGIRGGTVLGETDPEGGKIAFPEGASPSPSAGIPVPNIHATVLKALGIPHDKYMPTPDGRSMKLSDGQPIDKLLG